MSRHALHRRKNSGETLRRKKRSCAKPCSACNENCMRNRPLLRPALNNCGICGSRASDPRASSATPRRKRGRGRGRRRRRREEDEEEAIQAVNEMD